MTNTIILAGDIGGSKTNLALFKDGPLGSNIIFRKSYKCASFDTFDELLDDFLGNRSQPISGACFGVAGPVLNGRTSVTNLDWVLDEKKLADQFDLKPLSLINDLSATALGTQCVTKNDVHSLNTGKEIPRSTIGVIAPGTGLGEAFLTWNTQAGGYEARPSEGGHGDFAPRDALQSGLYEFLAEKYGHVSYERVCSGLGLPDIYHFLESSGYAQLSIPALQSTKEIKASQDPAPVIVNYALNNENTCRLCRKTLDIFVSVLAAEAANLALKVMATGGIFLGGGIPPRILPLLESGEFMTAFCQKGRMTELLRQIPVQVILDSDAALYGAAMYVCRKLHCG